VSEPRTRLDQPRTPRGFRAPRISAETFGEWSERIARYFGTARYLAIQTIFVVLWIAFNVIAVKALKFDPYPFILLNLAFSTQAAYAAPLILLAQNRQADRDRIQSEADRGRDDRAIADTEYLAREIASIRMALGEVATRDFLRAELSRFEQARTEHAKEAAEEPDGEPEPSS
jgi:uncharacterized membrane protein